MSTSSRERFSNLLALAVVLFVTVAAAFLRVPDLGTPGLWLDEILGVMHARDFPLFSRGAGPEPLAGPIYHGILKLILTFTSDEAALRTPFVVAALLSIPLIALVARTVAGIPAAVIAAVLLAASPIHIYYAREARPYALLLLELLIGLAALVLRPRTIGPGDSWPLRHRGIFAAALLALVLTSVHSSLFCAVLLLGAVARILVLRGARVRGLSELVALTVLLIALFVGLYGSYLSAAGESAAAPALTRDLLASLLQALVSGHQEAQAAGTFLPAVVLLIAIGAIVVVVRAGVGGLAVVLIAVGGLALPIAALMSANHWISVRYVLLALPGLLVLLAAGVAVTIEAVVRRIAASRLQGALTAGAIALVCVAIAWLQQAPAAAAVASKADWRYVAQTIASRSKPGDLILTSNAWSHICLSYYLPRVGLSAEVRSADESPDTARPWLTPQRAAFLVTGGFHRSQAIRQWMEEFPLVYSAAAEGIRVHFHPDRLTYLTTRAPLDEHVAHERALWAGVSGQLLFADERPPLLIDGWGNLEKGPDGRLYRWAEGARSRAYIPTVHYKPERLELHLEPFRALPSQSLTVKVDDVVVSVLTIPRGETFQDVDLRGVDWTKGPHVLALEFAASAQPGGTADPRKLTALIRSARLR